MYVVATEHMVPRRGDTLTVTNLVGAGSTVISGDQTVNGNQNVTGDVVVGGDMTVIGDALISGDLGVEGTLSVTGVASVGGDLVVAGNCAIGGDLNMVGPIDSTVPASILSTSGGQLLVGYDVPNSVVFDVSSAGDMVVDCAGNDVNFADTDVVRVLGILDVDGGLGVAGAMNVSGPSSVISTTEPQLTLGYNGSNKTTFDVSATGDLTIDNTGNDFNFASTDVVHVNGVATSTSFSTGALIASGGVGVVGPVNAGSSLSTAGFISGGAAGVADPMPSPGFRCSGRYSTTAEYPAGTSGECTITTGTITIVDYKMRLEANTTASWPSSATMDGGTVGTYRAKFTPNFVFGAALYDQEITVCQVKASGGSNVFIGYNGYDHGGAHLHARIYDTTGAAPITDDIYADWTVASGTEYDIMASWDTTIAAGSPCFKIWVDGVLFVNALRVGVGVRGSPVSIDIGNSGGTVGAYTYSIREIQAWPTVSPYWTSSSFSLGLPTISAPYICASNQLEIHNVSVWTQSAALSVGTGGDLTVDCSGNDVNFIGTNSVNVLGGMDATHSIVCGGTVSCGGIIVPQSSYTGVCSLYISGYRSLNADFTTGTAPLTATTAGTVAISSGKISIAANSSIHWHFSNSCDGGAAVAIRAKVTPMYTGWPNNKEYFFNFLGASNVHSAFSLSHRSNGELILEMYDEPGAAHYLLPSWSAVSGQEYEIEINVGDTQQSLYIDGARVSYVDVAYTRLASADSLDVYVDGTSPFMIRDIRLFTSIQHTDASYTPGYISETNAVDAPMARIAGNVEIRNRTNWDSNAVMSVGTSGDLSVDCSGNDFYFANTDSVHLLGGALYLPTAGGTPSPLSYFETFTSSALAITGPWTTAHTITLSFERIGNIVTLSWPTVDVLADGTANSTISIVGAIPARFLPSSNGPLETIYVKDQDNVVEGDMKLEANITVFVDISDQFTFGPVNAGIMGGSLIYYI